MRRQSIRTLAWILCLSAASTAWAGDAIPKAAWKRPLGLPLANPGVTRVPGDIDDGYWQGVPVGGMGAGTFSRSYRGDFARWHIKGGVHKYQPVYANQFAMFQQTAGDAHGTAQVLMNGHPPADELSSWTMGLSRRRRRLLCSVSEGLVRLQVEEISRSRCARAILSGAPQQLSRVQLSGRRLPLACRQSHKQSGHSLCAAFLDQHVGLVSHVHSRLCRHAEPGKLQ